MRITTLSICLVLVSALPAPAQEKGQEQSFHLLRGHISDGQPGPTNYTWGIQKQEVGESSGPQPAAPAQVTYSRTAEPAPKLSKLKRFGHGLAGAIRAAGKFGDKVAIEVLETMISNAAYSPPLAGSAGYVDTCVHGYTTSTCPYGYYGVSYGSPYLSGQGSMRMRPDYMGGYRFYTTQGVSGTLRPDYMGGYQMQVYP